MVWSFNEEFGRRYLEELEGKLGEQDLIGAALKNEQRITLVYSARDTAHNQAVVLCECLESRFILWQESYQRSC